MNLASSNIVPITKARSRLGDLADMANADNYFVFTKGGSPTAALVDFDYLIQLEDAVRKIYKMTYIDPSLEKYTRKFGDKEIEKWQKEDKL